jgi:4-amino-4-deoxy-L-arabinose transferase-like glycosyltransferase
MARNDSNRVLRWLPIVVGSLGGCLLLLNRILTPNLTDFQARSDVMGVILSAVLILTGLLWQRVQPTPPEAVVLEGEEGFVLSPALPDEAKTELAWASHLLLTNTVTRSVVAYKHGETLLRRGNFGTSPGSHARTNFAARAENRQSRLSGRPENLSGASRV